MADPGNITVRMDDLKDPFKARAESVCGSMSTLIQQFAKATLLRDSKEVWDFCFNLDELEAARTIEVEGYVECGFGGAVRPLEGMTYTPPLSFRVDPKHYGLLATGDSMRVENGETINIEPGQVVCFLPGADPAGKLVHAEYVDPENKQHCVTLKKALFLEPGKITLRALNKEYGEITLPEKQVEIRGVYQAHWDRTSEKKI